MTDYELLEQMREITGEKIPTCDLCGRQVAVEFVFDGRQFTDRDGPVHICAECRELYERGDEPLDELLDEDIEGV
ncbi:MAG: hypothetical protein M9890_13405 [Thermomicrobiales bacterium]|nr:hypothetical protein [Thermomicrobiales bacterium]